MGKSLIYDPKSGFRKRVMPERKSSSTEPDVVEVKRPKKRKGLTSTLLDILREGDEDIATIGHMLDLPYNEIMAHAKENSSTFAYRHYCGGTILMKKVKWRRK